MPLSQDPAGYSGTPLPKKLGIREGSRVRLVGAPPGVTALLQPLPGGASTGEGGPAPWELTLWFVRSRGELEAEIDTLMAETAGLWVCWPKQASGVRTDLTEGVIREAALARGLVDIKVCAVDATWSGLRLARRRAGAAPSGGAPAF